MGIAKRLIPSGVSEPFKFKVTVGAGGLFTLPLSNYNTITPNFSVSWGDTTSSTITSATDPDRAHTYTSAGTYQIEITGLMPGFVVNNTAAIKNLITSVDAWGTVGLRIINFYGCTNISTLPTDYIGLSDVEVFSNFMRSTGIVTIPSTIFTYAIQALNFSDAFSFTSITTIPSGLFTNNVNVTSFSSTFNSCLSLASCPSNLFDTNINVTTFSGTFRLCKSLTSVLQFTYNTTATNFSNLYFQNTTTNSLAGSAPELWNRIPQPLGTAAFRNCTGLTNFASIPANFK
jgi:hypothetical protein